MKRRRTADLVFLTCGALAVALQLGALAWDGFEAARNGTGSMFFATMCSATLVSLCLVVPLLWWLRASTLGGVAELQSRYPESTIVVVAIPEDPAMGLSFIGVGQRISAPLNAKLVLHPDRIELWKGRRPRLVGRLRASDLSIEGITYTRLLRPRRAILIRGSARFGMCELIVYPVRNESRLLPRLMNSEDTDATAKMLCDRFAAYAPRRRWLQREQSEPHWIDDADLNLDADFLDSDRATGG